MVSEDITIIKKSEKIAKDSIENAKKDAEKNLKASWDGYISPMQQERETLIVEELACSINHRMANTQDGMLS